MAITRTVPLSKPSGTLRGAAHRGKPGERSLFPYPMFQPTGGTSVASTAGSMLASTRCLSPWQGQAGLAEARLDAADPVAANTEQQGLGSVSWGRVWPQSCHRAGVAAPPPWWGPRNPRGGLCTPERRHKIGLKRPAEAGPLPRGDLRYLTAQEVTERPLGCRKACLHHLELNLRPAVLTGRQTGGEATRKAALAVVEIQFLSSPQVWACRPGSPTSRLRPISESRRGQGLLAPSFSLACSTLDDFCISWESRRG